MNKQAKVDVAEQCREPETKSNGCWWLVLVALAAAFVAWVSSR